jgi:hypothetical protein
MLIAESPSTRAQASMRRKKRRGAELLEFALTFIPLLAMFIVCVDIAWAVFAKSGLQRAVRVAVRAGVTLSAPDMQAGACLADTVKTRVQQESLGLLRGTAGRNLIKVRFFQPPLPDSNTPIVDVTSQSLGNAPGNIMEISVEGFSVVPLMPRIFPGTLGADNSPLAVTVSSADRIEPTRSPPCKGVAP